MSRRRAPLLELERHVARCRRRQEPAALMLARVPAQSRATGHRLACCYRLTDSVTLARVGREYELVALFDDDGFDRTALERRMSAVAGVEPAVVWARFPDDGVTLEALLLAARAQMRNLNDRAVAMAGRTVLAASGAMDGK
jgi:hypothetical protein